MELRLHRGVATLAGNFWGLYPDFPELYDRFALSTLYAVPIVHQLVEFRSARVLDVASGTGKNAIEHAKIARSVIGIEPAPKMREFATRGAKSLGLDNVEFRDGIAEDLSTYDADVFDIAVSMHGAPFPWDTEHRFVHGCERVVRDRGHIILVTTTPGWHPLHERLRKPESAADADQRRAESELQQLGFVAHDFTVDMDYGTQQEALETWGFIYGPEAIDYILDHQTSHQEWALRVYLRTV